MCMADYAISLRTSTSQRVVSVPAANDVVLVEESPTRVGLIISTPNAGVLHLSISDTANLVNGMHIAPSTTPFKLSLLTDGDIVRKGFRAIMSAGTVDIAVWETTLPLSYELIKKIWHELNMGYRYEKV